MQPRNLVECMVGCWSVFCHLEQWQDLSASGSEIQSGITTLDGRHVRAGLECGNASYDRLSRTKGEELVQLRRSEAEEIAPNPSRCYPEHPTHPLPCLPKHPNCRTGHRVVTTHIHIIGCLWHGAMCNGVLVWLEGQ